MDSREGVLCFLTQGVLGEGDTKAAQKPCAALKKQEEAPPCPLATITAAPALSPCDFGQVAGMFWAPISVTWAPDDLYVALGLAWGRGWALGTEQPPAGRKSDGQQPQIVAVPREATRLH